MPTLKTNNSLSARIRRATTSDEVFALGSEWVKNYRTYGYMYPHIFPLWHTQGFSSQQEFEAYIAKNWIISIQGVFLDEPDVIRTVLTLYITGEKEI